MLDMNKRICIWQMRIVLVRHPINRGKFSRFQVSDRERRSRGKDLERLFTDGPNPFGRTGRKKCEKCRFHRVRVKFLYSSSHSF